MSVVFLWWKVPRDFHSYGFIWGVICDLPCLWYCQLRWSRRQWLHLKWILTICLWRQNPHRLFLSFVVYHHAASAGMFLRWILSKSVFEHVCGLLWILRYLGVSVVKPIFSVAHLESFTAGTSVFIFKPFGFQNVCILGLTINPVRLAGSTGSTWICESSIPRWVRW